MPTAPPVELDRRLDGVVDLAPRDERAREAGHRVDLADEVAGEIDDVRGEVPERTGAGCAAVEAPDVGVGVAPVLEVAPAKVADVAEVARLDQLARQPDRGDEAVVESAQVLHARRLHALPDLVALGSVPAERLLANDVLAGLRRGDRRARVQVVGPDVVEEADGRVGHELLPVGRPALVAVARGCLRDRLFVSPCDRDEPRAQRRRPGHVADLPERVRVRLAHERVTEHANTDLRDVLSASRAPSARY